MFGTTVLHDEYVAGGITYRYVIVKKRQCFGSPGRLVS